MSSLSCRCRKINLNTRWMESLTVILADSLAFLLSSDESGQEEEVE